MDSIPPGILVVYVALSRRLQALETIHHISSLLFLQVKSSDHFLFSIEIGFFVSEGLPLGLLKPFGCPILDIPFWSPSLDCFAPVLTGRDFLLPDYFFYIPVPIVPAVFVTFHALGWRQYFSQHTSPPLENAVKRIYCHPPPNCRVAQDQCRTDPQVLECRSGHP